MQQPCPPGHARQSLPLPLLLSLPLLRLLRFSFRCLLRFSFLLFFSFLPFFSFLCFFLFSLLACSRSVRKVERFPGRAACG
jgi:hypothetical protein